ncbi:MAG: hypothetical protein AAGJ18_30175, partial [Bacteroidota bacterium]
KAYDNRGNSVSTSTHTVTVNLGTDPLSDSLFYDFDKNTEYWHYSGDWKPSNDGYDDSHSLQGFALKNGDFTASPGTYLNQGVNYILKFRAKARGSNRVLSVNLHTDIAIGGTEMLTISPVPTTDFLSEYTVNFQVPTDGLYHLVFHESSGKEGYRKVHIDEVKIVGSLNQAPLAKVIYQKENSRKVVEGADFIIQAEGVDEDGRIRNMEFLVNGQKVDEDDRPDYKGIWRNMPVGTHQIQAKAIDRNNQSGISKALEIEVVSDEFSVASYFGTNTNDIIRASAILSDGTVIFGGEMGNLDAKMSPILLDGATVNHRGTIIRLSPDGRELLSITKLGNVVADMSIDANDNLYIAAADSGFYKLDPMASGVLWKKNYGRTIHRVDSGPSGYSAILGSNITGLDEVKLTNSTVRVFDPMGNELSDFSGATTFTVDVCIDETTQTVIHTGYKNYRTLDPAGNNFPVDVPAFTGRGFDGSAKYGGYNWSNDHTDPTRWLNQAENNMADTRGARCEIGQDGKLYIAFECDGGNHILRRTSRAARSRASKRSTRSVPTGTT